MSEKHYYVADAFGWATDEDLETALVKRINDSGWKRSQLLNNVPYLMVYEVALPKTVTYPIDNYVPVVEAGKLKHLASGKWYYIAETLQLNNIPSIIKQVRND